MRLMMVRASIKEENIDEIEAAGGKLFSAIEQGQPEGMLYAVCWLPDGVTYLNFPALDGGVENPLPALPEAREFQEHLKTWLAGPPTSESLTVTVVGTYRRFSVCTVKPPRPRISTKVAIVRPS